MKLSTAQRYHRAWRRSPKALGFRYESMKLARKKIPGLKRKTALAVAFLKRLTLEEALAFLEKPWAWKTFVAGEWERRWNPPVRGVEGSDLQPRPREVVTSEHPELEDPMVWDIIGAELFPKLQAEAIGRKRRRALTRTSKPLRNEGVAKAVARISGLLRQRGL